jgi:hypothetical protein
MTTCSLVLDKGARISTLYNLHACSIHYNSAFANSSKYDHVEKCCVVLESTKSLEVKLPVEKTMLWHQRLGQIGEKGFKTLKNKILIERLNDCNLEFNFCEHYLYGNQHHVSF